MMWSLPIAVLLVSLASASVNDAGLNLGAGGVHEIDRKIEELLQRNGNSLDADAFTTEYLLSNKFDMTFVDAKAVLMKVSDPESARDETFLRQLAKVFDLSERLTKQLDGCPTTRGKTVAELIKKGKLSEVKDDLVSFVAEWKCPKEEDPTMKKSKFFGNSGLSWQYFEDMRETLKKNPRKAVTQLVQYTQDNGWLGKDTPPMVSIMIEQLIQNPEVAEYGITAIDYAETFFKSESGRRVNAMMPALMDANTEEAMEMFTKEADYNQEAFFNLIDNGDVANGFLKSVAKYVVMGNTFVQDSLKDNMKFAMVNGFLISNKMPVIDRRNIIKSTCQIVDRGIKLFTPWQGDFNFWPYISDFMEEFEKVYFKINDIKKMKEEELENVLRQFMTDNLLEPIKDAWLANRHVTQVDYHCGEVTLCLLNEIYRDRTTINSMMVGGISMGLVYSWDTLYEGHDTNRLYEALYTGQHSAKRCKSVYLTAPNSCDVFDVRRRELSGMNLGYEHNEL
jgi:hypothetical protein